MRTEWLLLDGPHKGRKAYYEGTRVTFSDGAVYVGHLFQWNTRRYMVGISGDPGRIPPSTVVQAIYEADLTPVPRA